MEDIENIVFYHEDYQVIYKQLLDPLSLKDLYEKLGSFIAESQSFSTISTGLRKKADLNIAQEFPEIYTNIKAALRDYFPDIELSTWARYYLHVIGDVKPHHDSQHEGNYTLLLYLNDNFEGGRLSIKAKRSSVEKIIEPEKNHKVYTFKPKAGWGVIFNRCLLHWAETNETPKEILIFDLKSKF